MNTTIHLTADERATFDSLPDSLTNGWNISEETLTCYESLRQIRVRVSLADFKFHPEVQNLIEQLQSGVTPDKVSIAHIGPEVQKELFFVIGARGVAAFIATMLPDIHNDADVEALATLTVIRHELLTLNASATHI